MASVDDLDRVIERFDLAQGELLKGNPEPMNELFSPLDRYSHWMPTMGKHTASAMDEVLDEAGRADASEEGKDAL